MPYDNVILTFANSFLSEFGVHLAELTVDPQGALAIRQVSFSQYNYGKKLKYYFCVQSNLMFS